MEEDQEDPTESKPRPHWVGATPTMYVYHAQIYSLPDERRKAFSNCLVNDFKVIKTSSKVAAKCFDFDLGLICTLIVKTKNKLKYCTKISVKENKKNVYLQAAKNCEAYLVSFLMS